MSILFIAILTYMIKKYEKNKSKIIYLTPLLFVLWGNLHGQFILGLAILVFWFIFYILNLFLTKELKNNLSKLKLLGISILLSLVAPLINPFGIEVYKTVIVHAFNPNLKDIMEYLPFDELSSQWWMLLSVGILVFLIGIFIFEEKIKIKSHLSDFFPYFTFFPGQSDDMHGQCIISLFRFLRLLRHSSSLEERGSRSTCLLHSL